MESRLEFMPTKQQFHLDNFTHEENTHGWYTICIGGEDNLLNRFIDYIEWKFAKKGKLTVQGVKKEFESFSWIVKNPPLLVTSN
jgi:hypothetical protein